MSEVNIKALCRFDK